MPLPLNLHGKNHDLVGLGSYLVNLASCNDCHSVQPWADGGNPFLGQPKKVDAQHDLLGGQAFGPFISRNLRPESGSGLPAGLTYKKFVSVMRHGTDFDKLHPETPLLQVMPWPYYQSMSDQDLQAIYEYLWALPPVWNRWKK